MVCFYGCKSLVLAFALYVRILFKIGFAGRLRNWNAIAFSFFKKFAAHFLNAAFGVTNLKDVPFPITVDSGSF